MKKSLMVVKKFDFFSVNIFVMKKLKMFDGIFLKFIFSVRRIDLKRFQNDSDSLKVRKIKVKKNFTGFVGNNDDIEVT